MKITATDTHGRNLEEDIVWANVWFLDLAQLNAVRIFGVIDNCWRHDEGARLNGLGVDLIADEFERGFEISISRPEGVGING